MVDNAPGVELPSALLGRWRLGQLLGEGGQGKVYRLHSQLGTADAVIKFLHSEKPYDVERFRREVGALATIDHPNVMRVLDHGMSPVSFYVAPKGEPLNKCWKNFRSTSTPKDLFERSARFIEQLASGLAAVHARKLVHRDIKPANVIVMAGDVPVLADFGIVHVPEADRITDRPAGNRFARDLAAFYDPSLASPQGDCLCLASLWAWMLASAPQLQHGNYHWRFHRFIEDERCDVARAVLALCSEPTACPKDGAAFEELLVKRFSLRQLISSQPEQHGTAAVRAYTVAVAESDTSRVALRSEIEVLALAVLPELQPLVATLRESAKILASQNLPAKLHVVGLTDPLAHEDVVRAMLSTEQSRLSHQLAYITCGDDSTMDFGVQLHIEWHKNPHEDKSKFSIHVRFVHEASAQVDQVNSRYYKILPNGNVEDFDAGSVAARIRDFLEDAKMWRTRTGPRNRPRGSFWG